jgi:hypothetical protein
MDENFDYEAVLKWRILRNIEGLKAQLGAYAKSIGANRRETEREADKVSFHLGTCCGAISDLDAMRKEGKCM